jgi:pimeloyl-ACP methyl ester carboxylesterase
MSRAPIRPLLALAALLGLAAAPLQAAPATPTPTTMAATDRMIEIDGATLHVREEGPHDAPPVILIHGFTFALDTWDGWAADLARDHRVIRYDLSGHGQSPADPRARYATADREAQLLALMNRLRILKAVIAGNSLGGLIAWNFAADHPDRVERLILIDSGAFPMNGVTDKPVAVPPAMAAFLTAPTPAGIAFTAQRLYAHPDRVPPARLETLRADIARNGPALVAHLEQFALPDPVAKLGRIKAPTLVLWGRADRMIPVGDGAKIAAAVPGAKLVVYDDVGHVPQEEAAETVRDVRAFLTIRP